MPRTTRAPDPANVARVPGTGIVLFRIPLRERPETWEFYRPAPRDAQEIAKSLRGATATDAAEVRLALPHRRGRSFTMARSDAAAFLAELDAALASGGNATLTLRGRLTGPSVSALAVGLG